VAIKKITTCSISRATRLSLDYCLYKWNTPKQMGVLSRATVASISLWEISTFQGYILAISWTSHKKLFLFSCSKWYMIVKYWFRELKDVLFCRAVRWKNSVLSVWERDCGKKFARAKMEILGIKKKAKIMVFQPQYAQCFAAKTSLPQINVTRKM
jgi:hypothetical protein